MKPPITVALVEWNWSGHHPTYFSHFASALLENGVKVLPVCPPVAQPEELVRKLKLVPSELIARHLYRPLSIKFPPPRGRLPHRLQPFEQGVRHFAKLGNQLRHWETKSGTRLDLVFFSCIYDFQFEYFRFAQWFFHYPWSGLYLHARSFRIPNSRTPNAGTFPCPEKIFTLPSMQSVGLLDDGVLDRMRLLTKEKPVVAFPDFTDVTIASHPDPRNNLALKLKQFAQGRPIIVCVGHLQKTKGLQEFSLVASHERMRNACFFLGGQVTWDDYSVHERDEIQKIWEQSPNIITHLQRLSDEATLNAVIDSATVVFAAYSNFPNSSNILTKAAFFKKPVIVSDGYLMAERVRKYQLGEVVAEGDICGLVSAIEKLVRQRSAEPGPGPDWEGYRSVHSYQQLRLAFKRILECEATLP